MLHLDAKTFGNLSKESIISSIDGLIEKLKLKISCNLLIGRCFDFTISNNFNVVDILIENGFKQYTRELSEKYVCFGYFPKYSTFHLDSYLLRIYLPPYVENEILGQTLADEILLYRKIEIESLKKEKTLYDQLFSNSSAQRLLIKLMQEITMHPFNKEFTVYGNYNTTNLRANGFKQIFKDKDISSPGIYFKENYCNLSVYISSYTEEKLLNTCIADQILSYQYNQALIRLQEINLEINEGLLKTALGSNYFEVQFHDNSEIEYIEEVLQNRGFIKKDSSFLNYGRGIYYSFDFDNSFFEEDNLKISLIIL